MNKKKTKKRPSPYPVRLIPLAAAALFLLVGTACLFGKLAVHGQEWVSNSWNPVLYQNSRIRTGTVLDRNGEMLVSRVGKGGRAPQLETRLATLHVTGDDLGCVGTGALRLFDEELSGYNALTGLKEASIGGKVYLSVSAEACRTAYGALDGRNGTVIVCNYLTGEILCLVSAPTFDPADPNAEIPDSAYLNRALQGLYTPGSVYKLVAAAAAVDSIPDWESLRFSCEGSCTVGDRTIRCTGYHGTQTLQEAFANSCNCAFAQLGCLLGPEKISETADRLCLTKSFSVNGFDAAAGSASFGTYDSAQLAWSAIGQGDDLVCPAAMLRLVSAVAAGGTAPELTLLRSDSGKACPGETLLSETQAFELGGMMRKAVTDTYGDSTFPGLTVHAKSGTAELENADSHAWFVGYSETLPYAFAVVIENGGYGSAEAAPVANAVLQTLRGEAYE